jgi:type IV secretion system protein VirB2
LKTPIQLRRLSTKMRFIRSRISIFRPKVLPMIALVWVFTQKAHVAAAGNLPWEAPLTAIATSLTGPVAYAIGLIGIAIAGDTMLWGGELSEFGRRACMIGLVVSVLVFAAPMQDQSERSRPLSAGDVMIEAIAEAVAVKLEQMMNASQRLMDVDEAARYLGLSAHALRHKASIEVLCVRIDAKLRFDRRDLDRWIDRAKREGV